MLSYQHGYHAGNAADLHKHAILACVFSALKAKSQPISYLETHSGRGVYNLKGEFAQKTGEAHTGIGQYQGGVNALDNALSYCHARFGRDHYPGSPAIITALKSPSDEILLCELHKTEQAELQKNFSQAVLVDGLEYARKVKLQNRRKLIHIDPSFEQKSEYQDLPWQLSEIMRRHPSALILLWYPMLKSGEFMDFEKRFRFQGRLIFCALFKASKLRMLGSQVMMINAPHGLGAKIEKEISPLTPLYQKLTLEGAR